MKKGLAFALALAVLLSLAACGAASAEPVVIGGKTMPSGEACRNEEKDDKGSWAIYWYICGSDLESDYGCATRNLEQLTGVSLPENVTIVIETGGAKAWQNDYVSASAIQRRVYNSDGLTLTEELPQADMGEAETLADFLRYASENYPADKEAVIFWDHGGGSLSGVCFDQNYHNDSLTLEELYSAFTSVWTPDADHPPLELVGFDACLMSTVDTAYTFCDLAHFLVASEETEPGNGWTYNGWARKLAEDPGMKGLKLGTAICDTFMTGCEKKGTQDTATLAVTDLNKIAGLMEAYSRFGKEALLCAAEDDTFATTFSRAARSAENYGGNTEAEGYRNLVDLGALAEQNLDYVDSAQTISDELEKCVVYRVSGKARQGGHGLSCYFSYDGNEKEMEKYREQLVLDGDLSSFYEYINTGELDGNAETILTEAGIAAGEMPEIVHVRDTGWDGILPVMDEEGNTSITLGPEADRVLSGVYYDLLLYSDEKGYEVWLGTDDMLEYDWENGVFSDLFYADWGQIDGHLVYMGLSEIGEDYDLYAVPIELNGEYRTLQVMFDYNEGWKILGAGDPADSSAAAGRLTQLQPGDEITTVWYARAAGRASFKQVDMDTFTYTEDTVFEFTELPEGTYYLEYEMQDLYGDSVFSSPVLYDYTDGTLNVSVYEE